MNQTALVIVDIQNGLCTGQWAMHDIDAVVDRINAVAQKARAAGRPVMLVQHHGEDSMPLGSASWQLYGRLSVEGSDQRISKTVCDAFHGTPLLQALRSADVKRVVICGAQTEFCVDSTVRGALAHGFDVTLLSDGHTTMDNGVLSAPQIVAHHNVTLEHVDSYSHKVALATAADVAFTG